MISLALMKYLNLGAGLVLLTSLSSLNEKKGFCC